MLFRSKRERRASPAGGEAVPNSHDATDAEPSTAPQAAERTEQQRERVYVAAAASAGAGHSFGPRREAARRLAAEAEFYSGFVDEVAQCGTRSPIGTPPPLRSGRRAQPRTTEPLGRKLRASSTTPTPTAASRPGSAAPVRARGAAGLPDTATGDEAVAAVAADQTELSMF